MSNLPLGRRLRAWALSAAQAAATRAPGLADGVRRLVPEPIWRRIRRAGAPVRIPRATAFVPLGVLPPEPPPRPPRSPAVSIVVPVHGELAHTRLCLASLRAYAEDVACEVVVVDDGSPDGTAPALAEWSARWPALRVVTLETNRGYGAAVNRGVAESTAPFLVLLNNDTVVPPGAIARLVRVLGADASLGIVGAVSNDAGADASAPATYDSLDGFLAFAAARAALAGDAALPRARISLFCAAIGRDTWTELGGLDESFGRGGFEDDDFCKRLGQANRGVAVAPGAFVHHTGGATLRRVPPREYVERFETARLRFERKWGVRWEPP